MRKFTAVVSLTALAALGLAGCAPAPGTASSAGCTPASTGSGDILRAVSVTGDVGKDAKVKAPAPMQVTTPERDQLVEGTGRQITSTEQVVKVEYTLMSSATGAVLGSTFGSTSGQGAGYAPLSSLFQSVPPLATDLMCAREGARIVAAVPVSALDPSVAQGAGLNKSDGIIAVMDVVSAMLPSAEGSLVFNSANRLPSVVRAPDGRPGVIVPDGSAPTTLTTQTLIAGDGAKIDEKKDTLVVQYTGVGWTDKTVFDSTWENKSPAALKGGAEMPPGFADALKGATVGSQIMVVVPKSEAAAKSSSGTYQHPTDQALVYVIDVLGVLPQS
ncbi:FKBP-type peptidyl-prolyl cis-trans isomerase [Microbacterium gorillae]|uniref:FKBP-type peptidyl-prolyl cis-trans isomerase n=1 Tax=Microbacterium gorillae TaxID=1231063 RepID=UPI00058D530D|nr:FKBP-type peptidyl-prolyl cis-trans isomerase [Microbacterium gorillae]